MSMSFKNIFKNIMPSAMVLTVGVLGAYTVYNVYFSQRVASSLASFEPAAGAATATVTSTPDGLITIETDGIMNGETFPPYPEAYVSDVPVEQMEMAPTEIQTELDVQQ